MVFLYVCLFEVATNDMKVFLEVEYNCLFTANLAILTSISLILYLINVGKRSVKEWSLNTPRWPSHSQPQLERHWHLVILVATHSWFTKPVI